MSRWDEGGRTIRVFELARELGVKSKAILEKCRAEGLDLKNHMSTLSAGLEATIREWFSEGAHTTTVETAAEVDLEKVRIRRKKSAARKKAAEAPSEPIETKQPEEPVPSTTVKTPAETVEQASTTEPTPEPAGTVAVAEPTATTDAGQEPPVGGEQAAAAVTGVVEPAEPTTAEPTDVVAAEAGPLLQAGSEPTAEVSAEALAEAPPEERQPPKPYVPPKPTVVPGPKLETPAPAKLQGPRVVRVDRPDRPLVRPRGGTIETFKEPVEKFEPLRPSKGREETIKRRRKTAASPRRRIRGSDAGERIKEWRERDLIEKRERLAMAGGPLGRRRATVVEPRKSVPAKPVKTGKVQISEPITIKNLSAALGVKSSELMQKLIGQGIFANINQPIASDTAELLAIDYGCELEVVRRRRLWDELVEQYATRPPTRQQPRAPVVTLLGHVDHGKTSLLDYIRKTHVAGSEDGGITQHISSYKIEVGGKPVVFLDTPGHEAFTALRARGAQMTDIAVLVVAADDGVMPQTVEAISHAKAAGVPIIVALNKIDLPNVDVNRIFAQLSEHGLVPSGQWGGDTEVVQTSAITGQGIDALLDVILLQAEMMDLKADPTAPASGAVIEAEMRPGSGVLANVLVQNGTLKLGDVVVAGGSYGRVRSIHDDQGRRVKSAGPATPVQITGLDELPEAGERFYVVEGIQRAKAIAEERREQLRAGALSARTRVTLENLYEQLQAGKTQELPLIIKADVVGSVQSLRESLEKLSTDEVKVRILHAAVGGITEGDVLLADVSDATIIGFRVVAEEHARRLAEEKGVDIRLYRVIYQVTEDVQKAMEARLEPEIKEERLGRLEVRQTFKVSRVGTIAGCYVVDGVVNRNAMLRLVRDNIVVRDELTLESLKRFKDDVREVRAGLECGLKIKDFDDVKVGDVLEVYRTVEVKRLLGV